MKSRRSASEQFLVYKILDPITLTSNPGADAHDDDIDRAGASVIDTPTPGPAAHLSAQARLGGGCGGW